MKMISKEGQEMTCATLNLCGMHIHNNMKWHKMPKDLSRPSFLLLLFAVQFSGFSRVEKALLKFIFIIEVFLHSLWKMSNKTFSMDDFFLKLSNCVIAFYHLVALFEKTDIIMDLWDNIKIYLLIIPRN